jgi:RNA polymerase sigma-70 factor (ECF subfamily)
MSIEPSFADLIRRVRHGDDAAAAALVRQYEPAIRRSLRLRLDPRLRRSCDSMDLCQVVLGSFFARAALGQFDLETPAQLLKLLVTMARNKLNMARRHHLRARRDDRRVQAGRADDQPLAAPCPSPSRQAAARDLLAEVRRRLSPEEQRLADLRGQGHEWPAIATEVGGNAEALRKQLTRALARVARELGLDEVDHE